MSNVVFSLLVLPVLEWVVPEDRDNRSDEEAVLPDVLLALHALLQLACLIAFYLGVRSGTLAGTTLLMAALSTGMHSGTSAIVVAHELIHRNSKGWQFIGRLLLFTAGNIYFFVEHLRVHHKWVGTPRDPATARRGENVYGFFLRSMAGQIAGAWRLESDRLKKEGRARFSWNHDLIRSILLLAACLCFFYATAGPIMVAAFLLQMLLANFLLEYTNYIEHYGLVRDEKERATEIHSWQTDKVISRFILIDLSRHADHHYYASKKYHTLLSYPNSPVLPGGYASALYVALIPPLWFRLIDPLLTPVSNPTHDTHVQA